MNSIPSPDYRILPTPAPTFDRYKALMKNAGSDSVTRILQYEALASASVGHKVLDFGGGNKAGYRNLIQCELYDSINISPDIEPTWVTEVGQALPCSYDFYDTVLTMNTLEHIYDVGFVIGELYKALKKDGNLICSVPFMHKVHGHPDDFFRGTPSWWGTSLSKAGFYEIEIVPLLWGPFSNGYHCSGKIGPFKKVRSRLSMLMDILYVLQSKPKAGTFSSMLQNYALAYFIQARKG